MLGKKEEQEEKNQRKKRREVSLYGRKKKKNDRCQVPIKVFVRYSYPSQKLRIRMKHCSFDIDLCFKPVEHK